MPPDPHSAAYVEQHWPHLVALADMLDSLPDTITIERQLSAAAEREIAEAVARQFNRAGGPTLTARAFE